MVGVIAKHQNIFSVQTGSLKGVQASLKMHTDVTAKFLKPRSVVSVPYALKSATEKDLERLENVKWPKKLWDANLPHKLNIWLFLLV